MCYYNLIGLMNVKVRTITGFVSLQSIHDLTNDDTWSKITALNSFLKNLQQQFEKKSFQVQTRRISLNCLSTYLELPITESSTSHTFLLRLHEFAEKENILINLGTVELKDLAQVPLILKTFPRFSCSVKFEKPFDVATSLEISKIIKEISIVADNPPRREWHREHAIKSLSMRQSML